MKWWLCCRASSSSRDHLSIAKCEQRTSAWRMSLSRVWAHSFDPHDYLQRCLARHSTVAWPCHTAATASLQSHSFQPQTVRFPEPPRCTWQKSATGIFLVRALYIIAKPAFSDQHAPQQRRHQGDPSAGDVLAHQNAHAWRTVPQLSSGAMCSPRIDGRCRLLLGAVQWSTTFDTTGGISQRRLLHSLLTRCATLRWVLRGTAGDPQS